MNSDPAGFNFDNKKSKSKTAGQQIDSKKKMSDDNPPDFSAQRRNKTVRIVNNS